MNEDGRMARYKDLFLFKKTQNKNCKIEDLIAYRLKNEKLS